MIVVGESDTDWSLVVMLTSGEFEFILCSIAMGVEIGSGMAGIVGVSEAITFEIGPA